MMRRLAVFGALAVMLLLPAQAQEPQPVPTIVPPTPVPYDTTGSGEAITSESAIARIQATGRVNIGVLYTESPFGEFTERGEIKGLDPDLARKIAEMWGVEAVLHQVTRQTALELLSIGEIDFLVAAQVHHRDLDRTVDFSQTYYLGSQSVMVRADDSAADLGGLNGRRIGVVLGSEAEGALRTWASRVGFNGSIETFVTLDRAYGALGSGQVDAIVSPRHRLTRIALSAPEAVKILDQPIQLEPYAIAFRRQDLPLRQIINRTLQVLQATGQLDTMRAAHFTDASYYEVPVWASTGADAPQLANYSATIPFPSTYAIPRIQSAGVLRAAGPFLDPDASASAQESERRADRFQRAFITQLVRRWGVTVEFITASPSEAAQMVADGSADIAVGVTPDWNLADRIDFSSAYMLHGMRMMAPTGSNYYGFEDLRGGGIVATVFSEPGAAAAAIREAEQATARIEHFQTDESSLAIQLLQDLNADVAFADSFKLMPHIEAYPNNLRLIDRWYSKEYFAIGLPLNDADFRLLVEYSIQALAQDGTLKSLAAGLIPESDMPEMEIYPGSSEFLGFNLN